MPRLTGANFIAGRESVMRDANFHSVRPAGGERGRVGFHDATATEINAAVEAASAAFRHSRTYPRDRLANLLRAIAVEIEALGQDLIEVANLETDLGLERLRGERARTCAQLRAFANLVEDGWYLEATIDTADVGTGRPDLRRMLIPIGPVAVFPASNFPFAFGVAGGDTASALAAGCPVVVKAHPSHPETSELFGRAITAAVAASGLHPGLFSMLQGVSNTVGEVLVMAPAITAVGFTGSLRGGRALYDLAGRREVPIPVYAEMGSVNPVFVTEGALAARADAIAEGLVGSMLQGRGQFCTKPGLVFLPEGGAADRFAKRVGELVARAESGPLLNQRMADNLASQVGDSISLPGVQLLAGGPESEIEPVPRPTVVYVDSDIYVNTKPLHEEHFGPFAVLVRTESLAEMGKLAANLAGNLTATVHAETREAEAVAPLVAELREKVGRLIWNGYPTGVAVTHAMQHGGPYPATTAPASTSVGSAAIKRFLRPVSYQNYPEPLLPTALRDANPLRILRLVNGRWTVDAVSSDAASAG
jgi:NADP-dependent aldehyde dehydrogenase